MRLTTIEQVVKRSTKKCNVTACKNTNSIHWHPHNGGYYCLKCTDDIEQYNGRFFERAKVKCGHCKNDDLIFLASHVGMCRTCHKKTDLPSHVALVKEEIKEATDKILKDIRDLDDAYSRKPTKWVAAYEAAIDLQSKVAQL